MRLGAKLPSSGPLPAELGVPQMARRLEQAGFASLWVSDHVVMPTTVVSRYPYSGDGAMTWVTDDPWYDALIVLAQAAAVTESVELGTAVLVLPQRNPVLLAKQVASLDRLAGGTRGAGRRGRLVGRGVRRVDDAVRLAGSRMDEWIALLRACWTGTPPAFEGTHYRLPDGVVCQPTPARPVPVLVGGTTPAALRRAREQGDGWVGIQSADTLDVTAVGDAVRQLGEDGRRVLRVVGSAGRAADVAAVIPELAAGGRDRRGGRRRLVGRRRRPGVAPARRR